MNRKGFVLPVILAVIAIFILAGGVWYFASRKSVPSIDTSGWQTYQSAWYGFQFKYPPDWTVKANNEDGVNLTKLTLSPKCGMVSNGATDQRHLLLGMVPCYDFEIYIGNDPNGLPAKDYVSQYVNTPSRAMHFEKQYGVLVGGYEGYELYGVVESVYGMSNTTEQIYAANGKVVLAFDFPLTIDLKYSQYSASTTQNNPIAHQIIDTLTFSNEKAD